VPDLKIIIWNVSHGLAVTLVTPNQRLIAYDAGRSEDLSPLTELMRAGWSRLDYFFLSHPHADHLRDIDALVRMRPRTMWRPRPPERQIREAAHGALEESVVDRYESELDQVCDRRFGLAATAAAYRCRAVGGASERRRYKPLLGCDAG
jgi:beta-lactamase superfamily II metal-dependent hydrolase